MNVATIKYYDIANGEGVRTSLFVSGCRHGCKGCFNAAAWDFNYGELYMEQTEQAILNSLEPNYIAGLTILGGEPFEVENQAKLVTLIEKVRARFPKKTVWIYSGFTINEILGGSRCSGENALKLLKLTDVLVDGRFIEEQKNISLRFRGSENQRVIDVKKTLERGEIITYLK